MSRSALITAALIFGIQFGWREFRQGETEYIVQIDDEIIAALQAGEPITSNLPPELQNVTRIRIQYGTQPVPQPQMSYFGSTDGNPIDRTVNNPNAESAVVQASGVQDLNRRNGTQELSGWQRIRGSHLYDGNRNPGSNETDASINWNSTYQDSRNSELANASQNRPNGPLVERINNLENQRQDQGGVGAPLLLPPNQANGGFPPPNSGDHIIRRGDPTQRNAGDSSNPYAGGNTDPNGYDSQQIGAHLSGTNPVPDLPRQPSWPANGQGQSNTPGISPINDPFANQHEQDPNQPLYPGPYRGDLGGTDPALTNQLDQTFYGLDHLMPGPILETNPNSVAPNWMNRAPPNDEASRPPAYTGGFDPVRGNDGRGNFHNPTGDVMPASNSNESGAPMGDDASDPSQLDANELADGGDPEDGENLDQDDASRSTTNDPWMMTLFLLCLSIGGNVYLGWVARSTYLRYREISDRQRRATLERLSEG